MGAWSIPPELLTESQRCWLVTGAAGFIGLHLVEALLRNGEHVIGVDNFSTSSRQNIGRLEVEFGPNLHRNFRLIEGDIRDVVFLESVFAELKLPIVLHQAALGSVPRSIKEPVTSFDVNATGFRNLLECCRRFGARRVVYASSSSVYGDNADEIKREDRCGRVLSPYAATKVIDEVLAEAYAHAFGMELIGLRYFNVFGPRQDPMGPYAAVIPRWCAAILKGQEAVVFGDGETSRDFCYVENVVQANLLAGLKPEIEEFPQVLNVGCDDKTSLIALWDLLVSTFKDSGLVEHIGDAKLRAEPFRLGDIRHSRADISRARNVLGYQPSYTIREGVRELVDWYVRAGETPMREVSGS